MIKHTQCSLKYTHNLVVVYLGNHCMNSYLQALCASSNHRPRLYSYWLSQGNRILFLCIRYSIRFLPSLSSVPKMEVYAGELHNMLEQNVLVTLTHDPRMTLYGNKGTVQQCLRWWLVAVGADVQIIDTHSSAISQQMRKIHWQKLLLKMILWYHDDAIKWKHFLRYWPFVRGNAPVSGEFPAQRPVTRSFDVFFDLRLNKRLSKQTWVWWFETLSCPLWRHCNDLCSCHGAMSCIYQHALYLSFKIPFIVSWRIDKCDIVDWFRK